MIVIAWFVNVLEAFAWAVQTWSVTSLEEEQPRICWRKQHLAGNCLFWEASRRLVARSPSYCMHRNLVVVVLTRGGDLRQRF